MSIEEDVGYLKAKAESTTNQMSTLFEKMDATHTLLQTHVASTEERHANMEADIEDCKAGVQDYRKMKFKGLGFVAGISTLAGSAASHIKDLFGS